MHPLPTEFVITMANLYGIRGQYWCDALPAHLTRLAAGWELDLGEPFPLSYNYVCAATQCATGHAVVLKTSPDNPDFHSEVAMLRHYNGHGAVALLDVDTSACALLMPAASPGTRLVDSGLHDDAQTHIAAALMRASITPAAHNAPFPSHLGQAAVLNDLPAQHPEAQRRIGSVHHAAAIRFMGQRDSNDSRYALHGDLHHENILRHGTDWLIIDPKGVIGEPAAECAAYLRNPGRLLDSGIDVVALTIKRIGIFASELRIPASEIAHWNYALMVLSAWWCYEEEQTIPSRVCRYIDAFAQVAAHYAQQETQK
jgi:streptomycin 6-kinase